MGYHLSVSEFRDRFASYFGRCLVGLLGMGILGIVPGLNIAVAFVALLICWPPAQLIGPPHFGSEFEVLPLTSIGWSSVVAFWLVVGIATALIKSTHRNVPADC